MFQSSILQKFIRSKLQDKLKAFFQLQKSKIQGFTIRHLQMKPELLKQLSQIIKIPLILKHGSIDSVTLNIPWQKFFSTKKDESLSITLSGIRINARLPNNLQRQYVIRRKKKIIQKFTQQFNKKATSRLTFLNKLKQHFFGTFSIQVKNLQLQINIDFKHPLIGKLTFGYLKFQKDLKKDLTKFQMNNISLGYSLSKQSKQQFIINKADMVMTGQKKQGTVYDILETKNLEVSFNNQNFNDIRRLFALIQWHNSFVDIPEKLWELKTNIIGQTKPIAKLKYVVNLIAFKVKQKKVAQIKKRFFTHMSIRRSYIKLFQQFRKNPNNQKIKYDLSEIQDRLQLWKVKQYRKFCLIWERTFPNQPHSILKKIKSEKKLQNSQKVSWLSYWFPKNEQSELKQLQKCLDETTFAINKRHFTLNIQSFRISVSIRSLSGKEPFLNLIALNNQLSSISLPLNLQKKVSIESQAQYQKHKKITIQKFIVEYDKYLGHHDNYRYFISQAVGSVLGKNQVEDEFQDIQNFLQCEITDSNVDLKLLPFKVQINEDTWQKFLIFKLERIQNTFQKAQTLIFKQNALEQAQKKIKKQKAKKIKTSMHLIIHQSMFQKQSQSLRASLLDICYEQNDNKSQIKFGQFSFSANLQPQSVKQELSYKINQQSRRVGETSRNEHEQSISEISPVHFQMFQIFSTSLQVQRYIHTIQQTRILVQPIKIKISSVGFIRQLIRFLIKIKPKQKSKPAIHKFMEMKRKQSIGEQFIDACQNLQQHLIRSKTISQKTKYEKYIVKDKKDKKISVQFSKFKFILQNSELQLSKSIFTVFQFQQYKSITTQQEKDMYFRIYNIKNFHENVKSIQQELTRVLELNVKKQQHAKKSSEVNQQGNMLRISNFNSYLQIYYDGKIKGVAELTNLQFQITRQQKVNADFTSGFAIFQYNQKKQKSTKIAKLTPIKQYIVEPLKIIYRHEKGYNKDEKLIKINQLNINIKPSIFIELGVLFDKINTPERLKYTITNSTLNHLYIWTSTLGTREYASNQSAISQSSQFSICLFEKEHHLLLKQTPTQSIGLTPNLKLIKTLKTEYTFCLQSNLRITNRQSHSIWLRVSTHEAHMEDRKKAFRDRGLVTYENLSRVFVDQSNQRQVHNKNGLNIKSSTSLNDPFKQVLNSDQIQQELEEIVCKRVNITTIRNSNINQKIQKPEKDFNVMQQGRPSLVKQPSWNSHPLQLRKFPSSKSLNKNKNYQNQLQRSFNRHQMIYGPILPDQTIQILLHSEQCFIELIERKQDVQQRYNGFKVKDALKDGNQILVHSYIFDNYYQSSSVQNKQISSTLVLATKMSQMNCNQLTSQTKQIPIPIYNIEVLSPIAIVNKIPYQIKFRFSKQEVDMLQVIASAGRDIRKRSFQATQLESIQPFSISRVSNMSYSGISEIQIYIKDYSKRFRLDHIIQNIKETEENRDVRIMDLLCLYNGNHEIQMGIEIRILKHVLKLTIFSQFIFVNLAPLSLKLQISQQNYNYPQISIKPLNQSVHSRSHMHKVFQKMSAQKLSHPSILKQLFKQYDDNISIFTGSFEEDLNRSVRYNNQGNWIQSDIYDTYGNIETGKSKQTIANYDQMNQIVLRKITIDYKPIHLVMFMPSLLIINKSNWNFFIKGSNQHLKKLEKNSIQYLLINNTIAIQAHQDNQEVSYNEWMKITLNTLGIFYYAKQMASSSGYESREYELRRKRLKKVPKFFFRIVLTKYEYGHQMLIEQSQYPPVSFINRCKSRIKIKQTTQNVFEQMQQNQVAEYASKIPHHSPKFSLLMVENYEFRHMGQFQLGSIHENADQSQLVLHNRVRVLVQQYKDKKIVIISELDQHASNQLSLIRNQLLLQKIERMLLFITDTQISVMNRDNKQISCMCISSFELSVEKKNTKRYVKLYIGQLEVMGYNGLQPRYIFYSKQPTSMNIIGTKEVLGFFKRKNDNSTALKTSANLMSSISGSHVGSTSQQLMSSENRNYPFLLFDFVVDYHKHASILQKCKIVMAQIVLVINANTLIEYTKSYFNQLKQMFNIINKHEIGRAIIREIKLAFVPNSSEAKSNQQFMDNRDLGSSANNMDKRRSISINNLSQNININTTAQLKRKDSITSPRNSIRKSLSTSLNVNEPVTDPFNRTFVIESFRFDGLKLTLKMQSIQNLQYFLTPNQLKQKYLIKFIHWIGDLRPLQFSPTEVQYEQYTVIKLLELIDVNKLIRQIYHMFLQYPLQELYHILAFAAKFAGWADSETLDSTEKWDTFTRIGKSLGKLVSKVLTSNNNSTKYIITQDGQLKQCKMYLQKFAQQIQEQQSILDRIMSLKYEQWRYKDWHSQSKLMLTNSLGKNVRLRRYNHPTQLLPYDINKSKIQLALDDYHGNMLFRQISLVVAINQGTVIGIGDDCFVVYGSNTGKQEWIVTKPQQILDIRIQNQKKRKQNRLLNFSFNKNTADTKLIITLTSEKAKNGKSFNIQKLVFSNVTATNADVEVIKGYLNGLKLSSVY